MCWWSRSVASAAGPVPVPKPALPRDLGHPTPVARCGCACTVCPAALARGMTGSCGGSGWVRCRTSAQASTGTRSLRWLQTAETRCPLQTQPAMSLRGPLQGRGRATELRGTGILLVIAAQLWPGGRGSEALRTPRPDSRLCAAGEAGGVNPVPVYFWTKSALGNVIVHPPARPARGWGGGTSAPCPHAEGQLSRIWCRGAVCWDG